MADPDPWRNQLRDALESNDKKTLQQLAISAPVASLPPATLSRLAMSLHYTRAVPDMVALLHQAQEHFPGDFWINHHLAVGLSELRPPQLDEALRYFTAAAALRPKSPGPLILFSSTLFQKGRQEEALALCQRALRLQPDYALAHNQLGLYLKKRNQLDAAIAAFRDAIRHQPDNVAAHTNLGNALNAKGERQAALAAHQHAIQLQPGYAPAHNNRGVTLSDLGRQEEALTEFRIAVKLQPKFGLAHANVADILKDRGELEAAVTSYQKALQHQPDFALAHFNLGNVLYQKKQLEGALVAYKKAIASQPDFARAQNNLGMVLMELGQQDGAIVAFRQAIHLEPHNALFHYNLGNVLKAQGKKETARASYQEAIHLQPDHAEANTNLGILLASMGKTPEAIDAFQKAVHHQPNNAMYHYNLGTAWVTMQQMDAARDAFRQALRLRPNYPHALCSLGQVLVRQGQFSEALKVTERGHELGSGDPTWTYNSIALVKDCQRLVFLEARLPAILKGEAPPPSVTESLELVRVCAFKELHAAAAKFSEEVFAARPELARNVKAGYRFRAAWSAAQAGCGQGKDAGQLDEKERVRWRQQALDWLRADLKFLTMHLKSNTPPARAFVQGMLQKWQLDPAFSGLRDPQPLARLPKTEQEIYRRFWGKWNPSSKQL